MSIVGLGRGTDRPTLLLDAGAAVSIVISAANVSFENIVFSAGHADITVAIDISATNASFNNCAWKQNVAAENFLTCIRTSAVANACDGLSVTNSVSTDVDTACINFVTVREDIDLFACNENYLTLGVNDNNAVIGVASGNSGIIANNRIGHADTSGEVLVDADGVRQFNNTGSATNTASGYVLPAIDS
mgnify:CR=1 FL=1